MDYLPYLLGPIGLYVAYRIIVAQSTLKTGKLPERPLGGPVRLRSGLHRYGAEAEPARKNLPGEVTVMSPADWKKAEEHRYARRKAS